MKKLVIAAMAFFILAGVLCLYNAFDLRQQRNWLHELCTEWDLFEADYVEDIKNIDRLRQDLEWEKRVCREWERMALKALREAFEYEMKYKEQYTINNIGLLSKGAQNDSND